MYLLVYGLSLPPFPSLLPSYPTSIVCVLHTPEKPVLEMYADENNGYCVHTEYKYKLCNEKFRGTVQSLLKLNLR